ncbi:hypothetical protein HUT16_27440 [Kitasatospora sp. NA04385]|uniref:hypothetical protein n=1 Tax=Kitasatospora sp. NA04385 TaxID=2742135 RepID=UPI001591F8EE|nr:hypothetical protein [Kitasatospora sp. NA04385]QKW22315.1 hypothetical protein HUT16_27440 [Kitasatospora sp. NA04385]
MASKDVELGRAAALVAEQVVGQLASAERALKSIGLGSLPDHAINGGVLVSAVPHEVLGAREVRASNTLAALWRLWAKAKNVVAMHPDMAAELVTYKLGTLPGQLFRNLGRFPNPIVVFAEPPVVELSMGDGGPGRLLAILFCGRTGPDKLLCYTSDPRMDEVGVTVICEPLADDGGPLPLPPGSTMPELEFLHLSIPVGADVRFTVEDAAKRIARKAGREESTAAQRVVVLRALQVAVYLCSSKADIQVPASKEEAGVPARRGKSAKPGKQRRWSKPENFLRMGWRLGPRLKAAREQAREAAARRSGKDTGVRGGWRQYPHQRGGHMKVVWYGPGKTLSDSKLIEPYWVSEDLLSADGQAPEGIIRPAR